MFDLDKIAQYIASEWAVITSAPLTFVAQTIAIIVIVWAVQRWAYGTVGSHKDGRIAHLEERLRMREDQLKNKIENTPPSEARKIIEALQAQVDELKPRRLTEQQKSAIRAAAAARGAEPYTLEIDHDMSSPDAAVYAADMIAVFISLPGWKVHSGSILGPSKKSSCGVALCVINPGQLNKPELIIHDVLSSAGLRFETIARKKDEYDVAILITAKLS